MAVRRDKIQVSVEIDAKQGVREYQKLLDESRNINNEMRKLQRAGKENSEEFKKLADRAKGVNKALGDLGGAEANFGQLLNRSKQLNRELRSLTPGTERFIAVTGELKNVNNRIKSIRDETRAVAGNLDQMRIAGIKIPPMLQGIAAGFAAIGALQVMQKLTSFFSESITVFADYNRQIKTLGALSGATAEEIEELDGMARKLGETTAFSASQVAQLEIEFSKLGFTPAEILAATADTLNLATIAGSDLGETATVVGATMRAFGLETSETQRVIDVAAKSFSSSALDLSKFSTAMAAVAPVAASAGVEIEEVTAMLGALVDSGLDASTAGTSLRNIFLDLAKNGMTLEEAFDQINNAADSNVAALDLFGKLGATTGSILAKNQGKFQDLADVLRNSAGFAEEASTAINADLRGAMNGLNSALEGLRINLVAVFERVLSAAIATITKAVGAMSTLTTIIRALPEFLKENKEEIAGLGVAILALNANAIAVNATLLLSRARTMAYAAAQQGAAFATNVMTIAQRGLNTAMRMNPIGLVVSALALLATGISVAYKRSETFRGVIAGISAVAREFFEIMRESLMSFVTAWEQLKSGDITKGLKTLGGTLLKNNPIGLAFTEGKRLKGAFLDGFGSAASADSGDAAEEIKAAIISPIQEVLEEQLGDEEAELSATARAVGKELGKQITAGLGEELADEDVTSDIIDTLFADEQDLLKNRFLKGLETEADYHQQRYELQQQEFERRLALLKQQHGLESQQFVQLENKKLEAQRDYEKEREELTRSTEGAREAYAQGGVDAMSGFVEDTIGFLQKEGDERKKQGLALKAFSVGKVIIDTEEAIMAIIKNAQANPANILFPGAGNIIQALKIGGVLAKSTSAISKINRTSFYAGGHTGNQVLMPDSHGGIVGGVHKNEWVAPAWQVKDPVAGPVIQWLEGMRRNGYVDGGFVGANSPAAAVARTPTLLDTKQLEKMMQEVRDSNMMVAKAVTEKQFSVMSGQLVDALDEEDRLNRKARF